MFGGRGRERRYILGFEESYGYLSGSYVRDKDAVDGAFSDLRNGRLLPIKRNGAVRSSGSLYQKYGYCLNTLHSYEFEGMEGFERMKGIMERLHAMCSRICDGEVMLIGGKRIEAAEDYLCGNIFLADGGRETINGLPASDVLKIRLEENSSVVVRPSGTEPKLKLYISVSAKDRETACEEEKKLTAGWKDYFLQRTTERNRRTYACKTIFSRS